MRKVIYSGKVIEVTPGTKRLTRSECIKSCLKPALWMISMFTIMGFIAAPIAIYGVAYLADVSPVAWQAIPIMGFMMTIIGALASLGTFIEPIPPTEEDVDTNNRRLLAELKDYYEKD